MQLLTPAGQVQVFKIFWSVSLLFCEAVGHFHDPLLFLQATAYEVQNLLVSGKKTEALQRAQDGQLWGPALVLASQLGDQVLFCLFFSNNISVNLSRILRFSHCVLRGSSFCSLQYYVDTVKQMALRQLVPGSPLRTLCLLIAGQPAEVFSAETTTVASIPHTSNMAQLPAQV